MLKRKNNINVYKNGTLTPRVRREQLVEQITKSDSYLPDSILHDDLDGGMLSYVKEHFVIISDGEQIPILPKILTLQRWGEYANNWDLMDKDNNIKLPFIATIRKPDVQPGTNPVTQRTIPDRATFYYASVPTWDGNQKGADIYKIPQPVAIDISFEVSIVCEKFTDLNKFNQKVLQKFSSRQSYTIVKGHYIPIILDSIDDNTPMNTIDGRRYYIQNYKFTMLGFLIDSEEFEVTPAISRMFLLSEFSGTKSINKTHINNVVYANFVGDGTKTLFSVNDKIGTLFGVFVNNNIQTKDTDYFHMSYTSNITFNTPPNSNDEILVVYYKGTDMTITDDYGQNLIVKEQTFTYTGTCTTTFQINNIVYITDDNVLTTTYLVNDSKNITFSTPPTLNSTVKVVYLYAT
jgi:hypothetical protein